jgi:predicted ATPase/DNA-binding CsgD family transcriptional regulator
VRDTVVGQRGGNLPAPLSSFVGRRQELAAAKRALATARLLTLVGPGGVGKTRVALRVAVERRRSFRDGVWLVEAGDLDAGHLVPQALLSALGLRDHPGQPPEDQLAELLRSHQTLLVLDNCEHVLDSCAALVEHLLAECPELRVLATSREPLDVAGEVVQVIPPLALPGPASPTASEPVADSDAVALFAQRAAEAVPGFHLSGENDVAVAEICRCLDGLPLAIELAAAWVRVLSPQQIRDRLDDRFQLLTRGKRTSPQRHRTLTDSLEWSFALCTPAERHVWATLGVLAGGCELDAAEAICDDVDVPATAVRELLGSLVEKSVVSREQYAFGSRFRMLETVREYAAAILRSTGRYDDVRRRHADWYEGLVRTLNREWISDRQEYWLVRMPLEHAGLRAALETRLAAGEGEPALRMIVEIPPAYLWARDLLGETRRWVTRALAAAAEPTPLRARGLVLAAQLAIAQGELATAAPLLAEGRELAARTGDEAALAFAGYAAATLAMYTGRPADALPHFEEALRICEALPTLNQRLDVLLACAVAAALAGDEERAVACHEQIVAVTEPLGELFNRSNSLWALGLAAWRQGDRHRAAHLQREALTLKWQIDDRLGVAMSVDALAWAAAPDDPGRAAVMLGGLSALSSWTRTPVDESQHQFAADRTACLERIRAELGDEGLEAAMDRGRRMSPDGVVAYCLGRKPETPIGVSRRGTGSPATAEDPLAGLTSREREIVGLVAKGLKNKEIAATLFLSRRTVEAHVQRVLVKLGFTSRSQVAALVARSPASPERASSRRI